MYERMLDRNREPTLAELAAHCGGSGALFTELNAWLSSAWGTAQTVTFPYGNRYGWGVAHRIKKKLICHVFAEHQAFTVMVRLSHAQCEAVYGQVGKDTQAQIDHKYPCGDGGWLHYRVTGREQWADMQRLLAAKCSHG